MSKAPKKMANRNLKYAGYYAAIAFFLLLVLFPVFWMVSTSLKPFAEWLAWPPHWLPQNLTWANYEVLFNPAVIATLGLGAKVELAAIRQAATPSIINSFIVAGGGTILALIVGYMAAYAISRYGSGGSFMYYFVLLTRMLPPIAVMIPLLVFFSPLGLIDTHIGLITLYATFTVAFVIWMMKTFIDDIPRDVEMAAMMDGYSEWEVIFKITLPLCKGGMFASALFVFILNWSEFLVAFTFTHSRAVTVPVQIVMYSGSVGGLMYGVIAALSVVAVIPMVILGYMVQKYLVRGLTFGAVRG